MANPRTIARLEARILKRAAHCLQFELSDPRATFITLTRVELTTDIAHAKVFWSTIEGEEKKAKHLLEHAAGYVQRRVARVLETRRVPRLRFIYDDSIVEAARMDQLIRDARDRDDEIRGGADGEGLADADPDADPAADHAADHADDHADEPVDEPADQPDSESSGPQVN